jgi:hypothetical protein
LEKKLNSELHKCQAFFHPDLFEQMMAVNNLKGRVDHENGTSEKHTWSALADLYNSSYPDEGVNLFDSVLPMDKHNHLTTNPGYKAVDLTNFSTTPIGGWEIKKYILGMFRLRSDIKKMMAISGTCNNDPLSYVDGAKTRVGLGVHRLALYYFFVKCKDNPRIDDEFMVGMPDNLKGSSTKRGVCSNDCVDQLDVSIACTVASCVQKTKQQSLDTSTVAFESIATTLANKEVREVREELKKGRLELMHMDNILPRTKKKIKGKLLADYGILPTPKKASKTTGCKSMSSIPEDIFATSIDSNRSNDEESIYS